MAGFEPMTTWTPLDQGFSPQKDSYCYNIFKYPKKRYKANIQINNNMSAKANLAGKEKAVGKVSNYH
jgi:hypothetical protein